MENGTILLAFYDGKRLVELQTAVYAGEAVTFTPEVSYTHVKAMIWDGLNSLSPVCEAKKSNRIILTRAGVCCQTENSNTIENAKNNRKRQKQLPSVVFCFVV